MLRLNSFLKILMGLLFLSSSLAFGFDDWQPVTPEDLKLTSDQAGHADAIILFHEETSDDNRGHLIEYKRIKIFTENGKRYADVEIPYNRGYFQIIDIKARTILPDGTVVPFSGKVFDKVLVKGHGIKVLVKSFTFSDARPGSIIEWRYTRLQGDHSLFAPRWVLQEELVQKQAKFVFIPYHGSAEIVDTKRGSVADGVYWSPIGLPKGVEVKQTPDRRLQLEMKDVPAYQPEELAPPEDMMKMRVEFYYGSRSMEKPVEFWKEEGKYWSKEVEKFIGHSSSVAQAASQAVGPADTPEQKVRKIYAVVQKLKNTSYGEKDFLQDLAETAKGNTSAEQTLRQSEGTRDEITRLFVAMVRAVSIPAFVMRVGTRDEVFFQPNLPSWRQLNSEIAIVHLADGKDVFLDPGTRFCPFGLLEWTRTAVQGVRQNSSGSTELAQTPAPEPTQTVTQRVAQLKLEEDGSLKGKILLSWNGQEALSRRIDASKTDEAGRTKALEDELRDLLPGSGSVTVKLESTKGWDEEDARLQGVFNVEIPSFANNTGKRWLLPIALFEQNGKQLFVHAERKNPIYLSYPYRTFDTVQITVPATLQVENLPETQPLQTDFAIYTANRTAKGKVVELRRDFAIGGFAFQLKEYPALKSFYEKVRSGDEEQVILQAASIANGK